MNILKSKLQSKQPSPPQFHLHQTLTDLQTHINSTLSNLQTNAKHAIDAARSSAFPFALLNRSPIKDIAWARIGDISRSTAGRARRVGLSLSNETIEKRLSGVPVFALCNNSSEFVLVTDEETGRSLSLFCVKEEDADTLLQHMKSVEKTDFRPGTTIVPVSLGKIIQLKVDGVAFRLLPEPSQIKNALEERRKAGLSNVGFSGVPVFQSSNLTLKYQDKEYRPVFLRKEDLERSLEKAALQQKHLSPAMRKGFIEVAVLEDVIKGMKDDSSARWNDVVFIPPGLVIPPGLDASSGLSQT